MIGIDEEKKGIMMMMMIVTVMAVMQNPFIFIQAC